MNVHKKETFVLFFNFIVDKSNIIVYSFNNGKRNAEKPIFIIDTSRGAVAPAEQPG